MGLIPLSTSVEQDRQSDRVSRGVVRTVRLNQITERMTTSEGYQLLWQVDNQGRIWFPLVMCPMTIDDAMQFSVVTQRIVARVHQWRKENGGNS